MAKFQFTTDQIEMLKSWKSNLNKERVRRWLEDEDAAEIQTSKILNDEKFKNGEDFSPEQLDQLFILMKGFTTNRNLSNLLYKTNGLQEFNAKLRDLIHGKEPLADRIDNFFKLKSMGMITLSQFLLASNTSTYPFVTSQTKEIIDISSEQDQAALSDAVERFGIINKDTYLDRTLDFLRDWIIFESIKNLLNLDKYTQINNLLYDAYDQEEEKPGTEIKTYSSVSIENDLRDYLSMNPSEIEKGMTLVKKEYNAEIVGRTDLLCKDKRGYHVVVELKKGRKSDEVVGQTLRYLGWVKEKLDSKVRGIIIVNEPDERLKYALNPLNDLIQLKYYKVRFEIKNNFEQ